MKKRWSQGESEEQVLVKERPRMTVKELPGWQ
jgi:hypothetical protein